MPTPTHPVFVYGTLRRGLRNHHLMADARFVGGALMPGAIMHDVGSFPALVPTENGQNVLGELYLVDDATLARLDRLEGCPRLYRREQVTIQLVTGPGRGVEQTAWVYIWNQPTDRLPVIPQASYKQYLKKKHPDYLIY